MNIRDYSSHLDRIVEQAIENGGFPTFAQYWEIYSLTADLSAVQAFYFRTESQYPFGAYCNAAIIGDGLLVDIEGDETKKSGGLTMASLDSISGVSIHAGSLPGLPSSNGASLVVLSRRPAETNVGLHWVAKSDEEEEHLLSFAKCLVQVISKR